MERSLVLVKPDAVQRGLCGTIIDRLENLGLKLTALKLLWMDEELARKHYAPHSTKQANIRRSRAYCGKK